MSTGIDIIFEVWGNRAGYIFVPSKNFKTDEWTEQYFQWPKDRRRIESWITTCEAKKQSVYWCPTLFTEPVRKKEYISKVQCLWADLDEVNPRKIPKNIRPHLAYETSPKRYQALWYLKDDYEPEDAEPINRNLTYHLEADKGGWDLTQVLRIPGLRNFKYDGGPQGNLLWNEIDEKSLNYYRKRVPEYDDVDVEIDDEDVEWADEGELISIVSRHKKKLKGKLFDLIFADEDEVAEHDRSAKLWEIECRLFEAGLDVSDVANIVRLSNWNKYRDRNDEKKRIISEVLKAKAEVDDSKSRNGDRFKDRTGKTWESYDDLMGLSLSNPGWLVEGWWQKNSHGIVAGEPKTYKSTFVTDFAASVASGKPLYGQYPVHNPGPVLMIQEENSPFLLKDRFRKVALHKGILEGKVTKVRRRTLRVKFPPSLPLYFLNNKGFDFTEDESKELLERKIKEIKPVLVIFDPLYLMLGGRDENSSKDVRPILNWMLSLRYTYNCGIMVVHHWNKSGQSSRGGQRMLGSVLFHGWVESAVYNLVENEEEHKVKVQREFRSFPKPKDIMVKYVMGNPGEDMYAPEISEEDSSGDLNELYEYIRSCNGVSEKDLVVATGLGRTALRAKLDILAKKGMVYLNKDKRPALWFANSVNVEDDGDEDTGANQSAQ